MNYGAMDAASRELLRTSFDQTQLGLPMPTGAGMPALWLELRNTLYRVLEGDRNFKGLAQDLQTKMESLQGF